ncbi:nucleotide sugar dehydrogenase [Mameliella alba]|uniref:UDP-glucose 6-dehydrogenase n=1 Tax=Mameliella alba TaxID=561184 RepID=A0A0B3RPV6_9RHOB|nr:UDP-glucose/GDP-mannose dehydrogenase family protein [Mameliella alba]KHQ53180.1 GDP-mannose dehydrogenase [Mameliella alba]
MLDAVSANWHSDVPRGFQPYLVPDHKPRISVVGLGYVGSVTAGCLASLGHQVVGVDVDPLKIANVMEGKSPIHEAGLDDLLADGVKCGAISATDDLCAAVAGTDATFVSVGTPTASDGSCDLRYIESVADTIGAAIATKKSFHVVVLRCSVPPGTTMNVMARRIEQASRKAAGVDFGIAFVPEFLREGVAVDDFRTPPKTVIGASDERSVAIVARIFEPVDAKPILTEIETAELVKHVDNVWHANKVCFANEIGRLSKALNIDGRDVMDIFCQDTKLNLSPYYLKPGFAYGGSCLPKEVRAMNHLAQSRNVDLPLIGSLDQSNLAQIDRAVAMLLAARPRKVAVLGLAFKPGTNDLRESPILDVIAQLQEKGIAVSAHDHFVTSDNVAESARHAASTKPGLQDLCQQLPQLLSEDIADTLQDADAVIVTHALPEYRQAAQDVFVPVIDVARLFAGQTEPAHCQGIGW